MAGHVSMPTVFTTAQLAASAVAGDPRKKGPFLTTLEWNAYFTRTIGSIHRPFGAALPLSAQLSPSRRNGHWMPACASA